VRRYIAEHLDIRQHHCDNLKSFNVAATRILVFVCSKQKLDVLYTEIGYSLLFRQENFKPVKYGRGRGVKYLQNVNINHKELDWFSVLVSSDKPTYEPKKLQSLFYILSVALLW